MGFKDHWFFGVFDGHGRYGHKVSHYLKRKLPENITKQMIKDNQAEVDINRKILFYEILIYLIVDQNEDSDETIDGEHLSESVKLTSEKLKTYIELAISETNQALGDEAMNSGST